MKLYEKFEELGKDPVKFCRWYGSALAAEYRTISLSQDYLINAIGRMHVYPDRAVAIQKEIDLTIRRADFVIWAAENNPLEY